jgi:hypothetical protein
VTAICPVNTGEHSQPVSGFVQVMYRSLSLIPMDGGFEIKDGLGQAITADL